MNKVLLEDTRQQAHKHELKNEYFRDNGIKVIRQALLVGDYTLPTDQRVCVDTKFGIAELIGDICGSSKEHERFRNECIRAREAGIKLVILLETDEINGWYELPTWVNPRSQIYEYKTVNGERKKVKKYPKATTGTQLYKAMITMQKRYGVEFRMCKKKDAGRAVVRILGLD